MIALPGRLLVIEGYDQAGMDSLAKVGATQASLLFKRMLGRFVDEAMIDIAFISLAEPPQIDNGAYAGVCWTGSNLFFSAADAVVQRHIDTCRGFFERGVPQAGSCWAAQLAAVAAGGSCERNPKGREFGIARKVALTLAGWDHPLFAGKRPAFDGFTSHGDIVTRLPKGAVLLAGNDFTPVQALEVRHGAGTFWAWQYHPEYDLAEIAALAMARQDELIAQGTFADAAALEEYHADMMRLHADPARKDIAWKWGIDDDLLDADQRTLELRNWLTHHFAA